MNQDTKGYKIRARTVCIKATKDRNPNIKLASKIIKEKTTPGMTVAINSRKKKPTPATTAKHQCTASQHSRTNQPSQTSHTNPISPINQNSPTNPKNPRNQTNPRNPTSPRNQINPTNPINLNNLTSPKRNITANTPATNQQVQSNTKNNKNYTQKNRSKQQINDYSLVIKLHSSLSRIYKSTVHIRQQFLVHLL